MNDMSNFRCGFVVGLTLILVTSAPSRSQQSDQSTINNQGVRALIAKSPPGKGDADYAREMNVCEGFSLRQNDQANTYADCMLRFGNRPNLPDGALGNSTPSPQNRAPQITAGPNQWVPPGPPRPAVAAPAVSAPRYNERWLCADGNELHIDSSKRVVDVLVPPLRCDLVITDRAKGRLGGNCPFFSENPLFTFNQFVDVRGPTVEFGYSAYGPFAIALAARDGAYAKYTINAMTGSYHSISGGGSKQNGKCVRQ
jgi:hypothetical protein